MSSKEVNCDYATEWKWHVNQRRNLITSQNSFIHCWLWLFPVPPPFSVVRYLPMLDTNRRNLRDNTNWHLAISRYCRSWYIAGGSSYPDKTSTIPTCAIPAFQKSTDVEVRQRLKFSTSPVCVNIEADRAVNAPLNTRRSRLPLVPCGGCTCLERSAFVG